MIRSRNLFWLLPFLALVSMPLWHPVVGDFLEVPRDVGKKPVNQGVPVQTFSMDGVVFSQSRKGQREWQIKADRLYTVGSEDYIRMERVAALFTGSRGEGGSKKPMYISGGEGAYYKSLKVLTLADDVLVHTSDGYEMQTESLTYLEGLRQFKTSEEIRILGQNVDLTGQGLLYDLASGDYLVNGRVYFKAW